MHKCWLCNKLRSKNVKNIRGYSWNVKINWVVNCFILCVWVIYTCSIFYICIHERQRWMSGVVNPSLFCEVAHSLTVELRILAWWLTGKSLRSFCLYNKRIEFINAHMPCHTWLLFTCWGFYLRSTWMCRKSLFH